MRGSLWLTAVETVRPAQNEGSAQGDKDAPSLPNAPLARGRWHRWPLAAAAIRKKKVKRVD
jgi:hypothetical protein